MMNRPDEAQLPPEDVSDDAFLGGQLQILQPRAGYRAGLDAVVLAATVRGQGNDQVRVLDAGAGAGVVGLCVARRLGQAQAVLVERDRTLAGLARANIARNGLEARARVVQWDLTQPLSG